MMNGLTKFPNVGSNQLDLLSRCRNVMVREIPAEPGSREVRSLRRKIQHADADGGAERAGRRFPVERQPSHDSSRRNRYGIDY